MNMMLSLFTASPMFSMMEDKIYAKYVRGVDNEAKMSTTMEVLIKSPCLSKSDLTSVSLLAVRPDAYVNIAS